MTVYYAHAISQYNTATERVDVETLNRLFPHLDVVNPNDPEIEKAYQDSGKDWKIFDDLVLRADVVAYRTLSDGRITSGVWKEVQKAVEHGIPVIELPNYTTALVMTKEETRAYLVKKGLR
jgi:hypothetical protein